MWGLKVAVAFLAALGITGVYRFLLITALVGYNIVTEPQPTIEFGDSTVLLDIHSPQMEDDFSRSVGRTNPFSTEFDPTEIGIWTKPCKCGVPVAATSFRAK